MATFVLTDADVTVGGVDLSDHVRQATVSTTADAVDDSAMGSDWRSRIGGVKDWSLALEFNQDFAASEVDATLWPLLGTSAAVVVKPTSGAVSSTNPSYSGNVIVTGMEPVSGSYGALATMGVSWEAAGELTRATS